jgi:hypothetical protein
MPIIRLVVAFITVIGVLTLLPQPHLSPSLSAFIHRVEISMANVNRKDVVSNTPNLFFGILQYPVVRSKKYRGDTAR